MTHTCPWKECGKELDDNTHHPDHEQFAKQPPAEVVRHPDGHVDIYRQPQKPAGHDCDEFNCEVDLNGIYRRGPHKGKRVPNLRADGTFDNPDNVPIPAPPIEEPPRAEMLPEPSAAAQVLVEETPAPPPGKLGLRARLNILLTGREA